MPTLRPSLAEWLAEQPFTLTLSSGFFGFFAHLGIVQALFEANLRPARYSGSSAGALVGGCMAAGCCPDQLADNLDAIERSDFWDPAPGLGLLAGRRFRSLLADLLPQYEMTQCPTPLSLSLWEGRSRSTRVVREGQLIETIYGSCAVPFLFQPASIQGRWYWDGGIADRHGLAGTGSTERVFYHHLMSRSPWRRPGSPALKVPQRDNLVTLQIADLPRSGPSRLAAGRRARQLSYEATKVALDQPVVERKVSMVAVP